MTFSPNPKPQTLRDENYLNFIRSQPCLVCGDHAEPHHEPLNGHGMSCKGPDNETLPLCREHHTIRHQKGRETFYSGYRLDWRKLVVKYQIMYDEQLITIALNKELEILNDCKN